jgi:uncharacterized membrane protein
VGDYDFKTLHAGVGLYENQLSIAAFGCLYGIIAHQAKFVIAVNSVGRGPKL